MIKFGAHFQWLYNNETTTALITAFYHQLKPATVSKAQALQLAQKQLIKTRKFRHPAFYFGHHFY